ncbi:MAG: replication-associated recombination protein A [Clostridia bacterium]|nr:replication-associated recombination protein A [Clostridia bacterium]
MAQPLAARMRPESFDDMVGQKRLFAPGAPLRSVIESGTNVSMVFYGPSGTGKTTAARIIARRSSLRFEKLNGTTASTADIRAVIDATGQIGSEKGVLLYLDEIQYFNKKQQQTLLEFIENGSITLIASTTENPYFSVYGAVLSRCAVFEFKPLSDNDLKTAVNRAFDFLRKENSEDFAVEPAAVSVIASAAAGDCRKAVNLAEACFFAMPVNADGKTRTVTAAIAGDLCSSPSGAFDRGGDSYYDLLSAFQKSMRGSDPDAAVFYLARILESGDLISACRRLMVCACEDVGLAYPMIIPIVKSAVDAAMQVGLPEARIPLADAAVLVATSPKSNTAYKAYEAAAADIAAGRIGSIPRQLQNRHLDGAESETRGQNYLYPHDYPNRWVRQRYLPTELGNKKYYVPGDNKMERAAEEYWKNIKK